MAVDMFLKIGDIKGESTDAKHPDEIQIESFSFGQAGDVNADSGQRTGKVALQDYNFVMPISAASPRLMTYCADGRHIQGFSPQDALLTCRKPGANPVEFLKIKFYDVMISSFQAGAAQADIVPTDQFSLWFGKIELAYIRQNPDGSLQLPVYFRWDRSKGESF
ncbi:MAG: Hcp family type VI secretion system effector [Gaiellaceae bacterium]